MSEAVDRLRRLGHGQVTVAPYFLASGRLTPVDPDRGIRVRHRWPAICE